MKEGKQLHGMILSEDMQNELSEAVIARLNDSPSKSCLAKPNDQNQMVQN